MEYTSDTVHGGPQVRPTAYMTSVWPPEQSIMVELTDSELCALIHHCIKIKACLEYICMFLCTAIHNNVAL